MPRRNILPITRDMKLGGGRTITVTVDASELDGSYTVFVETNFEPDASDARASRTTASYDSAA